MRQTLAALVLSTTVVVGCQSAAEQQAQAEKELFLRRKTEFAANPGQFLDAKDIKSFNKGIINDYAELTGATITNSSALSVKLTGGRVIWLDALGVEVGSTPVTFKGTIGPGLEQVFSKDNGTLSSGTIQGKASKLRIEYTTYEIIEPRQQ